MVSCANNNGQQWRRHGLLLLLTLFYGETFIGRQIIAVMIEPIKLEFGASDTQMGLMSGLAFAVVFAVLGLPAGQLADKKSRTRILAFCALAWAFATALCGFAVGFYMLVAARMLVAVAEVPIGSSSMSLIADLYPLNKRAFAISCYSSAATLASIVALGLGAYLIGLLGWRHTFLLLSIPALILSAIFFIFVKEPIRGQFNNKAQANLTAVQTELNTSNDTLADTLRSLWAHKRFKLLVFSSSMATMSANAFGMWNITFLMRSHQLDLYSAGVLAGIIGGGAAAIGILLGGYLADKRSEQTSPLQLPIIGHILGISSLYFYLLWPSEQTILLFGYNVPVAMFACALTSFFSVWWVGPCFSLLTHLVPTHQRAVAIACQSILVSLLGMGIGPVLVGGLSDILSPSMGLESLRYALIFSSFSTIIAVILLIRLNRIFVTNEPDNAGVNSSSLL
ncbi:MFS transporter [Shewanella pealeana]|uniref:Major facilitator superfamily MFS_1 n=1 Tax=Shewanella pealeana (strain ATCC 700345 / ANG-SQ1) TaxID=398579 RepID=A8H4E8_SHEPA|nr:MFS transporter [Shewanella pealeana]ABV87435.1 major facilitator superfamily MFS_1 [Shewanella pealeana ATCC 700345]